MQQWTKERQAQITLNQQNNREQQQIQEQTRQTKGKNPWDAVLANVDFVQNAGGKDTTRMKQVMQQRKEDVRKKGMPQ